MKLLKLINPLFLCLNTIQAIAQLHYKSKSSVLQEAVQGPNKLAALSTTHSCECRAPSHSGARSGKSESWEIILMMLLCLFSKNLVTWHTLPQERLKSLLSSLMTMNLGLEHNWFGWEPLGCYCCGYNLLYIIFAKELSHIICLSTLNQNFLKRAQNDNYFFYYLQYIATVDFSKIARPQMTGITVN